MEDSGTSTSSIASSPLPNAAATTESVGTVMSSTSGSSMRRSNKNWSTNKGINVSHLVNFQYEQHKDTNSSRGGVRHRKNQQTRSSCGTNRRRTNSNCYLHSSSHHAFVIRREWMDRNMTTLNQGSSILPWDAIDTVKVLVDVQQQARQRQAEHPHRCPICLEDPYLVPRCFPCGHIFCLVCILQYSHFHYLHANCNSKDNKANQHNASTNSTNIPCPCCSRGVSIPKELRPVQFQSISSPSVGCHMVFRKLYRYKSNSSDSILLAVEDQLYTEPPIQSDPNSIYFRWNTLDTQLALQQLTSEVQTLRSMDNTTPKDMQPFLHMAQHMVQFDIHSMLQQQDEQQQDILNDSSSKSLTDISSYNIQPFYQAMDGQLCFLCGFTMRCLLHEYTCSDNNDASCKILPDVIEGRVLSVETFQLDPTIRKRYSFLQQYPPYIEIQLVELQFSSGILSKSTKQFFSKEFLKRKKTRLQQQQKEQQQQQQQQQRHEKKTIGDSSSCSYYYHHPIPETSTSNSAAASPLSEDFGPSLLQTSTTSAGAIASTNSVSPDPSNTDSNHYASFKAVLTKGSIWPELSSESSPLTQHKIATTTISATAPNTMASKLQSTLTLSTLTTDEDNRTTTTTTPKDDKVKTKKKKVVLFSTGGHRGSR